MHWTDDASARQEMQRLKDVAINTVVDIHPQALAKALAQYGSLLQSSDLAEVIRRREAKLAASHAASLAAATRGQRYGQGWEGLWQHLRDLIWK